MAKLCKCGCGQEIVAQKHHKRMGVPDFIRGHSSRMPGHFVPTHNVKHTEESKKKMSDTRIGLYCGENSHMYGKHQTEETKQKISIARIGKYGGENAGFYGKHHTDENKQIQSTLRREQYSNGNNPFQDKTHTAETIKKISDKALVRNANPEYRAMISQTTKNAMVGDVLERLTIKNRERGANPEWRKKKSELEIDRWKNDKEFAERMRKSRNARPNKSEIFLGDLLNETYPNEWKFVGDFSFILNGKNPDFVNCNGKKLIIELFGEPWHKGETQEDRAKFFTPFGYRTLVVWWKELKKVDILKSKIERFINESHI
jgi:hypothetical protein